MHSIWLCHFLIWIQSILPVCCLLLAHLCNLKFITLTFLKHLGQMYPKMSLVQRHDCLKIRVLLHVLVKNTSKWYCLLFIMSHQEPYNFRFSQYWCYVHLVNVLTTTSLHCKAQFFLCNLQVGILALFEYPILSFNSYGMCR